MTDPIAPYPHRLAWSLMGNAYSILKLVRDGEKDVPMIYITETKKIIAAIEREMSDGKRQQSNSDR